ncbi:unnamed protein product [Lactuca saligna]|uniref:Uncharacterized protein n=1 Tax=Lactuca saligna TaxID=75948 RepID=A0AA35YRF7_LACSI|nr:unnamed protein product [Lactuca saligna]
MDDIEDGEIVGDVNRKRNESMCRGGDREEASSDDPKAASIPSQASPEILESQKAYVHSNEEITIPILIDTELVNANEARGDKPKKSDRGTVDLVIPVDCKADNPLLGCLRPTSPTSFLPD